MSVADNIKFLRTELGDKAKLVAVSKTKPVEMIKEAYDAGHLDFGENKVQELVAKQPEMPSDVRWHMIGHLQSNKVKYIAPFVYMIHAVDSLKLLKTIQKEAKKSGRCINVLIQFHIAQEDAKFGFTLDEARNMLKETIGSLENVNICGVMGMATFTENKDLIRKEFQSLKYAFDVIKKEFFSEKSDFREISMGMSKDYQIAVEEGSTMVRIGSSIFGLRACALKN